MQQPTLARKDNGEVFWIFMKKYEFEYDKVIHKSKPYPSFKTKRKYDKITNLNKLSLRSCRLNVTTGARRANESTKVWDLTVMWQEK